MSIYADTDGQRILVTFPYDARDVAAAKDVPGRRWHAGTKTNRYPLTSDTCLALRRAFGSRLQVSHGLAAWFREETARMQELEMLRAGKATDLPRVRELAPALWQAMSERPFQIAGAAFVTEAKRVCLGDEPRLGKTYQAIAALIETDARRVLIACPRTATRTVWLAKLAEFYPDMAVYVAQGTAEQREMVIARFEDLPRGRKAALVINSEMIRIQRVFRCLDESKQELKAKPGTKHGCHGTHKHQAVYYPDWPQLFREPWDAIILDECHHALASTGNTNSINNTQIHMGAMKLKTTPDALKLALSGTPFRSRREKSWGVLNWCRPDVFTSFWRYAEQHFKISNNGFGNVIGDVIDKDAFANALRPYYLARTKADAAPYLPPVETVELEIPLDEKQRAAYAKMAEMSHAEIENGRVNANGILAQITRLKQLASCYARVSAGKWEPQLPSSKFDWFMDFLAERDEKERNQVVWATQFTALANLVAAGLRKAGYSVVTITGESSDRQREEAQYKFRAGEARIAVINMFAGGEAIDLSAADELILNDEPWTADAVQQVQERITNLAKDNQLTVYRLRGEGTIESWIASLTDEQRAQLAAAKPQALAEMLEELS